MLRLAALMGAGTFGVHQARYALGYHGEASGALAAQGHAYLVPLGPLLVGALLPLIAAAIRRAACGAAAPGPRFARLWAAVAVALVAVYLTQESVEGALAAGHPAGVAGALGHGGWLALPLSVVVGFAIAVVMRGAQSAGEIARRPRPWRAPLPVAPRLLVVAAALASPGAGCPLAHAARGPPARF
jgi:hypothetical protein